MRESGKERFIELEKARFFQSLNETIYHEKNN